MSGDIENLRRAREAAARTGISEEEIIREGIRLAAISARVWDTPLNWPTFTSVAEPPFGCRSLATVRELNQQTAQVLARVEAGETVTITRNGRPVAVMRAYDADDAGDCPFRTDPMDDDNALPVFEGPADFGERADDYRTGFGSDHLSVPGGDHRHVRTTWEGVTCCSWRRLARSA